MSAQIIDFPLASRLRQFEPHYQPIVELETGLIVCLEAVLGWSGGAGKRLSADEVLRAAQRAEMNLLLDQETLTIVQKSINDLPANKLQALNIAINLSVATCCDPIAADELGASLLDYQGPASRIRIEFPLEAIVNAADIALPMISRLSRHGFSILVDHVDRPVSQVISHPLRGVAGIKLHMHLLEQLGRDDVVETQLHEILEDAKSWKLPVAVDGLNRLDQLEWARRSAAVEVQGPLISRYRPMSELDFLLQRKRCW